MSRLALFCAATGTLVLILAACATPTTAPEPTLVPPPTVALATMPPAVPVTMGAAPAIQVVPLQGPEQYYVGVLAQALVLAADSDGVSAVDLNVDGQVVDSVPVASAGTLYQGTLDWTPPNAGAHDVVVTVHDGVGNVTQAKWVTVQVLEAPAGAAPVAPATPSGDTAGPSVSISAADAEVNTNEDVDINVNAVDAGGVVKMELYANDELVETWTVDASQGPASTSVFHTFTFRSVSEGQYDVVVKAYDAAGNVGQSETARIDVNPAP